MKAHTIALAIDEMREEPHSRRERRLGRGDLPSRGLDPRERAVQIGLRAEVYDTAVRARLVFISRHDASGHGVALVGKDRHIAGPEFLTAQAGIEDVLVEADGAVEIGGGNLE